MGLKKHAVEATKVLHLKDASDNLMYADAADGQPDLSRPIRAVLYGPGSRQNANAQTKKSATIMGRLKNKGKNDPSTDERLKEEAGYLADCTKAFENVGEDFPGLEGRDLAMAIYSDISIGFVKDQVNAELGDWANFTKTSATD